MMALRQSELGTFPEQKEASVCGLWTVKNGDVGE